jgi:hypothetical protein
LAKIKIEKEIKRKPHAKNLYFLTDIKIKIITDINDSD